MPNQIVNKVFILLIFSCNMFKELFRNLKEKRDRAKIDEVVKGIKNVEIQGARTIAKEALNAYHLLPNKETKERLVSARPTEPMLVNAIKKFDKLGYYEVLEHFDKAQEKINKEVSELLKDKQKKLGRKMTIFTHCHSTNVVKAIKYSYRKGVNLEVYNTETRPLYQGRKTSKELSKAGIDVTTFTDNAAMIAIKALQKTHKADMVFLGSDAILKNAIVNKVGSGMFAAIANENNIPVYIIADSWKYTKHVDLEKRDFEEVWKDKPKETNVANFAFEEVPKKHIKRVISEMGTYTLPTFIKKVEKREKKENKINRKNKKTKSKSNKCKKRNKRKTKRSKSK